MKEKSLVPLSNMPTYESCPFYKEGPDVCCGAKHQVKVEYRENFTVEIPFPDGHVELHRNFLPCLQTYLSSAPGTGPGEWASIFPEGPSEELVEAVESSTLSTADKIIIYNRTAHPGIMTTKATYRCPLTPEYIREAWKKSFEKE